MMRTHLKADSKTREQAIQMLNEGKTPLQVSRALGFSRSTIYKWRLAYIGYVRPQRETNAARQKAIELMLAGGEAKAVATELGYHPETIRLWYRQHRKACATLHAQPAKPPVDPKPVRPRAHQWQYIDYLVSRFCAITR